VLVRVLTAALAVGLMVFADMRSKSWAASQLRTQGARTLAAGHLRLEYQENAGSRFGWLWAAVSPSSSSPAAPPSWVGRPSTLIASSSAMAVGLTALLLSRLLRRSSNPRGFWFSAGLAALLAGTLGNLHDRLERGYVIDFIDYAAQGRVHGPVFNLADVALTLGIALCVVGFAGRIRAARGGARLAAAVPTSSGS
jgi:signal peptidase II